jgi:hypothetical protein
MKKGATDILFVEEALRHALGKDGPRLYAVMELLVKEGRAEVSEIPGCWYIDKAISKN